MADKEANLKMDDDDDETASTVTADEHSSQADPDTNVRIFLRVKPTRKASGFFNWDDDTSIMEYNIPRDVAGGLINNTRTNYKFRFDAVIGMESKQEEVFDRVGKPCVDNALRGFNSTVFAYGQTGSGKTFTITGGAERYEDRGLIPRALSYVFEEMKRNPSNQLIVHISYLEIYNNQGYDLLDPNHESTKSLEDLPKVSMLEDEDGNCHLRNLSMHLVHSEEEALNLLFLGDTNRAVSETAMNLTSSRSHCVFTVSLESRRAGSEIVLRSKLHLVDLAGSERAHKTGAKGQVLKEASYINISLHYLEMVIVALHERRTKGRVHIPYRNSMLTSVLRDSLGGNCKTAMVATVSAESEQTDESVSTCRFAQRVARVQNDAHLNEEVDPAVIIRQLKARVASLEEELAILKGDVDEGSELKDYEIEKLRQRCQNYIDDADPHAHMSMGEFTYAKMKTCFAIFKELCQQSNQSGQSVGRSTGFTGENQANSERESELEQLVQQRDNEIAIMVKMIQDAKAHGAKLPDVASIASSTKTFAKPPSGNQLDIANDLKARKPLDPVGAYISEFQVEKSVLEDPMKALDAFKARYPKNDVIQENKRTLKQKYDAAKSLATSVNEARQQIKQLTAQMEKVRKQQAMVSEGLVENEEKGQDEEHKLDGDLQRQEEDLKEQIESYKATYKKGFHELSELKKEIQHIQKMLEMSRLKLQKDFDMWYQQQGKGVLLAQSLLSSSKSQEQVRGSNNNEKETDTTDKRVHEAKGRSLERTQSPRRPESPMSARSKAADGHVRSSKDFDTQKSKSKSVRSSVASSSTTTSSVDEDVSGFYEALDILKRRNARK